MLEVTTSSGLGQSVQQTVGNLVVVNDHLGNPLVVVQEVSPGVSIVVPANDPDFNRVLSGLGLDKVVVCNKLLVSSSLPAGAELVAGPGSTGRLLS